MIHDQLRRLQVDFAKHLQFEIPTLAVGATHSGIEWIVVSTPGLGPDGVGGYTYDVMGSLKILSYWGLVRLAYDWKGSTNQFKEDTELWDEIFSDPKRPESI